MTSQERDLTLAVMDNCGAREITMHLFQISRHTRKMQILSYLVRQNITGRAFLNEIKVKHQGSVLNFMADIVKRIDRDVSKRPIIAGRDWI